MGAEWNASPLTIQAWARIWGSGPGGRFGPLFWESEMVLEPHDLHWLFSRDARTVRAFNAAGVLVFSAEARNRTVNDAAPVNERWAPCPPGLFVFGTPIRKDTAPFGPWAVPLLDAPGSHTMADNGRSGIMWHGGGSGLPHPLADDQSPPWVWTLGCWRSINGDLRRGVTLILASQHAGGKGYVTVVPFASGEPPGESGDWLDVPVDQLDPAE